MTEFCFVDEDPVRPTEIEHRCEEIFDDGAMTQRYNYLVYHFVGDGAHFTARAYLDSIDTVSVYGPFEGRDSSKPVSGPMNEAMLAYLKRRFRRIEKLGDEGEGYVTLWSADEG